MYISLKEKGMKKVNQRRFRLLLNGAWFMAIALLLASCSSSKTPATPEQLAQLQTLAEGRNFTFEADFALPQTSQAYVAAANRTVAQAGGNTLSRISLGGEGYFMKIKGDSVESHLPYYGVRDNFSEYGRPEGIELASVIENFRLSSKKSGAYQVRFDAREKTELFQITLDLFPGGKANLFISSGQRDAIRFEGKVLPTQLE